MTALTSTRGFIYDKTKAPAASLCLLANTCIKKTLQPFLKQTLMPTIW